MKIVLSERHHAHRGEFEFWHGEFVPCYEKPERADFVLAAVTACGLGPVLQPEPFSLAPIERVHAPRYLRFLERAWDMWSALGQMRATRCRMCGPSADSARPGRRSGGRRHRR